MEGALTYEKNLVFNSIKISKYLEFSYKALKHIAFFFKEILLEIGFIDEMRIT